MSLKRTMNWRMDEFDYRMCDVFTDCVLPLTDERYFYHVDETQVHLKQKRFLS